MAGAGMELRGTDAPLAELAGMIARAGNPQGMFDNIGMSLVTSTQHRFETGIAPDGSVWPASIRALTEGGKTLIDSARLMQSISYRAWDAGVEWGTNVIYAAIHNFGGTILQAAREAVLHFKHNARTGRTRFAKANSKANYAKKAQIGARTIVMPARPFLGLDDADSREILLIAEEWIASGARP